MSIKKIRIFGIPIFEVTSDDEDDDPGDVTSTASHFGFIADDLPTEHRRQN